MNRRIHYLIPFCLLFACDKTERDWSRCSDAAACAQGYTCSLDYRCVPVVDAAAEVAAPAADAGGREAARPDAVDAALDVAADAAPDVVVDIAVVVDVAVAMADAAADLSTDKRPVDSQGSCSADIDCPATAPLCLDFRCAKCKSNNDCASRADSAVGAGVCDTTSGRCVVCAKSTDCTADPTKPVCVANQCVACSSATDQCRVKDPAAPVCDSTTGKCVGCLANGDCASNADGGVDGGADGGADGGVAAGLCNLTTNQCVGCLTHANCNDPSRPICGSSQTCVGCGTQIAPIDGCATKNPGLPLCNQNTGACVECTASTDCHGDGGLGVCNPTTNKCVECNGNAKCTTDPAKGFCVNHACAGCQTAGAGTCTGAKPRCAASGNFIGQCVECTASTDCRGDAGLGVCNPTTNKCVECNGNADCTADPAKGFCVNNACAGCQTAGAGTCTGAKPMCATSGSYIGQCVECVANTDCKVPTKPVCTTNQCRACAKDLDCAGISPAGVCGLDGSCPGDNAVIYLQNSSSCPGGSGTLASPYCSSDDATTALSATKTVIVVKGNGAAYPVGPLTLGTVASSRVLVAGQSSARIANLGVGSHVLVSITAGDVTLRDLTISGGNDAGVSVSNGATLHMDRCYVLNNQGIGIHASASAFDIMNTVVAGNGAAAGGYGVSLENYSGSPTTFAFNTVVSNVGGGVFCGTPSNYPLKGILGNGNGPTSLVNFVNCVTDGTSSTASPNFGTNYHLTATSPCVNAGGATCPSDDIDGDTRPIGTACDCGADEYKP